jgi:hypothetical protein
MPRQSRLLIRSALIWLAAAAAVGGLMLAALSFPQLGWAAAWRQAHSYSLLFGWLVQFAVGSAYWMLPRLDAAGRRGAERRLISGWILLKAALSALWLVPLLPRAADLLQAAGAVGLAGAGICWLAALLPRVLPWRALPRP